jgi:hypothetical protein
MLGDMFVLIDDHGTQLGAFRDRGAAVEALRSLAEGDPLAAHECAVAELDRHGRRVGEFVTVDELAPAAV